MTTSLFTNFTDEEFTGHWDGKPRKFAPGQSVYMPTFLAEHFAKHLANRELLRRDSGGTLIYKDGEKFVSPKKPEEVPLFMELFNKAFTIDEDEVSEEKEDELDTQIKVANKNRGGEGQIAPVEDKQESNAPQVVTPPAPSGDDESSFEGKPVEAK